MASRTFHTAVVVEDNPALLEAVAAAIAPRARTVRACATVAEARAAIEGGAADLMIVDVALPDGTARDVLVAARCLSKAPAVVVMSGAATPVDAFELAKLGAGAFVPKPLDMNTLDRAIDDAAARGSVILETTRELVGHVPIHDAERAVRQTMVEEALARSGGKRGGAARLLGISRQLLQHILRATSA